MPSVSPLLLRRDKHHAICLSLFGRLATSLLRNSCPNVRTTVPRLGVHLSAVHHADFDPEIKEKMFKVSPSDSKWVTYNDIVYPPQKEGEPPRPAEICHVRHNIRGSEKKMWYAAVMVRGLSIDEAIKQCSFGTKKWPHIIKEVLLEAQDIAINDHNVEFKSNLWVADSFCGRGIRIKGIRKNARLRMSRIVYKYCHYFVRLREGPPPEHYYPPELTGNEMLEDYIKEQRRRTIKSSL